MLQLKMPGSPPSAAVDEPIVLVCAADDRYAMGLAVTVTSALVNLKSSRSVQVFVLDGGISATNRRRLERTVRSRAELHWIFPDRTRVSSLYMSGHLSSVAYYRLLIPELLPSHLSKVIYLDSDLIVQGDLNQLWELPLQDQFVLAVRDLGIPTVSSEQGLVNYRKLGLHPETGYFNSGVLVLNLEQWRQQAISRRTLEYIQRYPQYVRWHDQDGLNAIFAGQWGELDPRWNRASTLHRYASWQDTPYSETVYQQLLRQPYIIHFVEGGKPWTPGFRHPDKARFFHYLNQTAWPTWQVQSSLLWQRCQAKLKALTHRKPLQTR